MSAPIPKSRPAIRFASVAFLAAVLPLSAPSSASASSEFGHHVQTCAQGMGFDGSHNPGMHSGYAGWDPSHVC